MLLRIIKENRENMTFGFVFVFYFILLKIWRVVWGLGEGGKHYLHWGCMHTWQRGSILLNTKNNDLFIFHRETEPDIGNSVPREVFNLAEALIISTCMVGT